jgi:hypothetical protein
MLNIPIRKKITFKSIAEGISSIFTNPPATDKKAKKDIKDQTGILGYLDLKIRKNTKRMSIAHAISV